MERYRDGHRFPDVLELPYDASNVEAARRARAGGKKEHMAIYIGPDQMMPVGSFLGTLLGLVLIFWSKLTALFTRITGRLRTKNEAEKPSSVTAPSAEAEEARQR